MLARVLVLEGRANHAVDVLLGRKRHGPRHGRAGASRRLDDLSRRRLDRRVIVGLEANAGLVLGRGAPGSFWVFSVRCLVCRFDWFSACMRRAPGCAGGPAPSSYRL